MMRDPGYTEDWVDDLVLRIRKAQAYKTRSHFQAALEAFEKAQRNSPGFNRTAEALQSTTNIRFSRASETNLAMLRNLPPATNILLFTPVLIPAGQPLDLTPTSETMDPFEAFGRALSTYHRRIRHVPYVASVGFTETHDAFISQADAVITVVCEPEHDKYRSVGKQMDFAEAALDSLESKEANAANALVLVQAGASEHRLPVDASFMNVIECKAYNAEVARYIAHTIFNARV